MTLANTNNNPGNLRYIGQIGGTQGQGGFASFPSPQEGYAALMNDLQVKINKNPDGTLADFANKYAPASDNNNPAQYTANLANKLGVRPDTKLRELQPRIGEFADAVASNEGYASKKQGYNPKPFSNPAPGEYNFNPQTEEDAVKQIITNNPNEWGRAADQIDARFGQGTAKKYNDQLKAAYQQPEQQQGIIGKTADMYKNAIIGGGKGLLSTINSMSGMGQGLLQGTIGKLIGAKQQPIVNQQDITGLSTEASNAAQAGGKFGEQVAEYLVPGGVTSKLTKGAGLLTKAGVGGLEMGGMQAIQSGKVDKNTGYAALTGAALPIISAAIFGIAKKMSGVTPQMENALRDTNLTEADYNSYINAAKERTQNIKAPSPLEMAANQLDDASVKINQNYSEAGKAVGAAKKTLGSVSLPDTSKIIQDFTDRVENDYGLQLVKTSDGVEALPLTGRTIPIGSNDVTRISDAYEKLIGLQGSNARNATDVIKYLDNDINYNKLAQGKGFDPIEGLFNSARQDIDSTIRPIAPELARANDTYSELSSLKTELRNMAGGQNQRGELLMRRVFSGDKSGDVQNLFEKIKQVTGIDLVGHSVLARHAIEIAGDQTQKTLLQQAIETGIQSQTSGIIPALINAGKWGVKKTIASPEVIGRSAIGGSSSTTLPSLFKGMIGQGFNK